MVATVTTSYIDGVRIVCISDTHNQHRDLDVPSGDILIHAGDFTLYGKEEHAHDFNDWLGTLPHKHKIVVNGNHENNADWKERTSDILTHATFLRQGSVEVEGLKIFGCEFFWPVAKGGVNAYYSQIPDDASVIITHGPVAGYVDGGTGCRAMLKVVQKLSKQHLQLVVSGHVHRSHGITEGTWMGGCSGVRFVNAANCGDRTIEFEAASVVMSV
jgi:predicted phosphodiesterase